jgi:hypothetical protein
LLAGEDELSVFPEEPAEPVKEPAEERRRRPQPKPIPRPFPGATMQPPPPEGSTT